MNYGQNIKKILDKNKMSQADLARALNTKPQNITALLKTTNPGIETLKEVARAMQVDLGEIIEENLSSSNAKVIETPLYIDLPFVSIKARAGFIETLFHSQKEYYPRDTYPVLMEPGESYMGHMVFEIDGDSMEPLFVAKTKVRAKPIPFNDWKHIPSGIYIVNYANTYVTIKRVKTNDINDHGYLVLHPENTETAGSQKINAEDINHIWQVVSIVYAPIR